MKRAALCLALVGMVGLVGFGWNPGDPIPGSENPLSRTSSFTIPGAFVVFAEGDLNFAGVDLTNVTAPGYIGWAKTNTLTVYGLTNRTISVKGEAWAYVLDNPLCPKKLPTRLTGYVYVWNGSAWLQPLPPFPSGGSYDIPLPLGYRTSTQVLPGCAAGYYKGEMYLEVLRNGYMDPAGTYMARITITVTAVP